MRWAAAEEEGFGRTLAQGERLLADLIEKARGDGAQAIPAEEAFRLHDTFGFPFELTTELLAEQGLGVDQEGFAGLMDQARVVARGEGRGGAGDSVRERASSFAKSSGFTTNFVGYESTEAETVLRSVQRDNGTILAKLEDSPFYAEGGGQVSDGGVVETASGRARVADVVRLGSDQALALEPLEGDLVEGERVHAVVERDARLATMRNHTATHLLHAALRERLGTHVRQAGSYVGPDKLRFDFTHGERMSEADLRAVEERVNGWIAASRPVRAIETSLDEAKKLGAMALFGEKYGDWVRMVEVAEVSRELCGGTHVAGTAEVGLFHITNETSSASNVRRIEAVTGPEATRLFEQRTSPVARPVLAAEGAGGRAATCRGAAGRAREGVAEAARGPGRRRGHRRARGRRRGRGRRARGHRAGRRGRREGAAGPVRPRPPEARRRRGGAGHGRRRSRAPGGPGGARADRARPEGRPDHQGRRRGGGRRRGRARHHGPGRRPRSREARRRAGGGPRRDRDLAFIGSVRVLALDHGEARCGCAVSDPSGTLATPLEVVQRPDSRKGLARLGALAAELDAELVLVGLPLTLAGERGHQAEAAQRFADALARRVRVPVELYDERLTTRMAAETGGRAQEDSRAAAHLLESWLAARGHADA